MYSLLCKELVIHSKCIKDKVSLRSLLVDDDFVPLKWILCSVAEMTMESKQDGNLFETRKTKIVVVWERATHSPSE